MHWGYAKGAITQNKNVQGQTLIWLKPNKASVPQKSEVVSQITLEDKCFKVNRDTPCH